MNFRLAKNEDLNRIMEIIEDARKFLKDSNIDQWQDGYPNKEIIKEDIKNNGGYILVEGENIIAYVFISFGIDEDYKNIDGKWLTNDKYATIHRMAIDRKYRGKGIGSRIFDFAEELSYENNIFSIKIDTDNDNELMKHLINKKNYTYCGIIQFNNTEKIAFEKILTKK